jgi:hypothetical protein
MPGQARHFTELRTAKPQRGYLFVENKRNIFPDSKGVASLQSQ